MPDAFLPLGNARISVGPLCATAVSLPPPGRNLRIADPGPSDALVAQGRQGSTVLDFTSEGQ